MFKHNPYSFDIYLLNPFNNTSSPRIYGLKSRNDINKYSYKKLVTQQWYKINNFSDFVISFQIHVPKKKKKWICHKTLVTTSLTNSSKILSPPRAKPESFKSKPWIDHRLRSRISLETRAIKRTLVRFLPGLVTQCKGACWKNCVDNGRHDLG